MIDPNHYYSNYHGHKIEHIKTLHKALSANDKDKFIWLAGDSTLDNKLWLSDYTHACNGYDKVFTEPYVKSDVCYWMNKHIESLGYKRWAVINTAVEASSINERRKTQFDQDIFISENISEKDLLVVSIGGNDIAAKPKVTTLLHMAKLFVFNNSDDEKIIQSKSFKHIIDIFKDQTEEYINSLIAKRKPRKIIVCTMYYPCLSGTGWADKVLKITGYNKNPGKVHHIIQLIYQEATSKLNIPGVKIIPVPLYDLMDYRDEKDYVDRVEPSVIGGRKISQGLIAKLGFQDLTPDKKHIQHETTQIAKSI